MIRLLVEGFVASTLLAAGVWTVCLLGKRLRLGPAACHALWVVVLVKLLLPPLFAWPWALRDAPPSARGNTSPINLVHQAQWWLWLDLDQPRATPAGTVATTNATPAIAVPAPLTPKAAAPAQAPVVSTPVKPPEPWLTPAHLRTAIIALWLAGATTFLLIQLLRTLHLRRHLRRATADPDLSSQVAAVSAQLRIPAPRAWRIPAADSPYIWAFLRPILLWPSDMDSATPNARGLLAHELAHLRRRDHWVGILALLAGILWWWNPVYWLIRRQLHRHAELCCDAWAVRILNGSRRTYASALIDVSERAVARRVPALALGVRATRHELEGRLTMIMTGNPNIRPGIAAWALAATLLALTLPAWSQATATPKVPFSISKQTTVLTEPLLPDGTPDYVAAFNAKYGKNVTPENNGFIPFLKIHGTSFAFPDAKTRPEILKLLGTQESPPNEPHFSSFAAYLTTHPSSIKPEDGFNILIDAERQLWTPADHPELADYLQTQAPFFDLAIETSKRPHFYCPLYAPTGNFTEVLFPRVTGQVDFFRTWITRATLRAASGDIDGAAADIRAMKQLARLLPNEGTIVVVLLGYVADAIATDAASIIASSGKLTPAQCDALARAVDLPPMPSLANPFTTGDRYRLLQLFQWTFLGKFREAFGSNLTDEDTKVYSTIDFARIDGDMFLREFNAIRDREVAVFSSTNRKLNNALAKSFEQDLKQWTDDAKKRGNNFAPDLGESKNDYTMRAVHTAIAHFTARMGSRATETLDRQFQSDMLPTLFAAAKFKAQTGNWPAALQQLVPAYVKEIPADPYADNNAAIQYVLLNNRPRLFSVGPDRKPNTSDDLAIGQPDPAPPSLAPTPKDLP
jgi:beta-lactamase regulating signal transducer with metallopeptidase domain